MNKTISIAKGFGILLMVLGHAEFPVIRTYALKGWWIVYTIVGCVCPLLLNRIEDFFYWACKKMLKKSSV